MEPVRIGITQGDRKMMTLVTWTFAFVVLDHGRIVATGGREYYYREQCMEARDRMPLFLPNGDEIRAACLPTAFHHYDAKETAR
jgi:hypothetical protein